MKNVGGLGKLIVAKACKRLPKVQKIAKSGHTGPDSGDAWNGDLTFLGFECQFICIEIN